MHVLMVVLFKILVFKLLTLIILCTDQIYATIRTGSIAIAASTLDSLLDLLAGGILWFTHISMKNINIYKYPIGKLRMQPVGIIIFAAVMATLGNLVLPSNLFLWSIDFTYVKQNMKIYVRFY